MAQYGLTLSSEEHEPQNLIETARTAEEAGFDFLSISDHFHPWITAQGHSPFVWSVLGAISQVTDTIEVGVGVTCPTVRIHPAINAQAAATTACLLEDRFVWGVGSGENLNEHILGDRWPPAHIRLEMLAEALAVIRRLWTEETVTHRGQHYVVEDARIFDRPDQPPPILVSAFAPESAQLAAEIGDGLWTTGLNEDIVDTYHRSGGDGPIWTQLTVSWDDDREQAIDRAHREWPNTGLPGQLAADLRTIQHMEEAVGMVDRAEIASSIPCGPDPEPIIQAIKAAADMGVDHVYLHQIGNPLDGFIQVWEKEIHPAL